MASKIISLPGKFIVGDQEIANLGKHIAPFGKKALLVAHDDDVQRVHSALEKSQEAGVSYMATSFRGECSDIEIQRICSLPSIDKTEVVIGLGGGKAIDTAKCVASHRKLPLVVVPTIASTDAPCSTLAVIYTEDHVKEKVYVFSKNPDIVVVDSRVIANAPARYLAAGIGDAYATYFEARACLRSGAKNYVGGRSTIAAFELSKACRDVLLKDGRAAMEACKLNVVTPPLENIIEANLLLSGIGFESVGLACAHSIYNAMTILPEVHPYMHGEIVAFGVLVQHVLEHESQEQIRQTLAFYKDIGLPTKLSDIGLAGNVDDKLRKVAENIFTNGPSINNLALTPTSQMVYDALKMADTLNDVFDNLFSI